MRKWKVCGLGAVLLCSTGLVLAAMTPPALNLQRASDAVANPLTTDIAEAATQTPDVQLFSGISGIGGSSSRLAPCPTVDLLYGQNPTDPAGSWSAATSDANAPYLVYDNFTGVTGDIAVVHWWGLEAVNPGTGWSACVKTNDIYTITFYNPGTQPGAQVVQFTGQAPLVTNTGETYGGFPVYYYELPLPAPVSGLSDGWISIQGENTQACWFLWCNSPDGDASAWQDQGGTLVQLGYSMAMCLIGQYVPRFGACCDDYWGTCNDNVEIINCLFPLRFAENTLCVDLTPPCGIMGACCDDQLVCIGDMFEGDCDAIGNTMWYEGETCASFTCPATCEHTVELWDSYGDGWNGCSIDLYVNGVPIFTGLTLLTGTGPETHAFQAATGDSIVTTFTAASWPTEPYYYIYDINAYVLCADGLNNTQPVGCNTFGNCGPPPTGACCFGPACQELTEADCLAGGGIFYGAFVPCDPNPCPQCCEDTVTTFPYAETFETGTGFWYQDTDDDFDWTRDSGGTPSSSTGPAVDHTTGTSAGFYMYTESSSPNYPNKTAILNGPCYDLSQGGLTTPGFLFWYHMYGATQGTMIVELSDDDCVTWQPVWQLSGDQGNTWFPAQVDLTSWLGQTVKIRIKGITGSSFTSDMAIDDIWVGEAGAVSGGCCVGTSCTVETETDCNNMGGYYQGDFTTCGPPNPCSGACCDLFTCLDTTNEPDCYALGGTEWVIGEACPGYTCTPYCSICWTNTTDDWITNVTFESINNTTGQEGPCSYADYTYLVANLSPGATYQLSVTFFSAPYSECVTAWFDWNADGVWDTTERYQLGCGVDATLTAPITVPNDAAFGFAGFRVTEKYSTAATDPCVGGSYGETEDYGMNIAPTPAACCLPDGSCIIELPDPCMMLGGVYGGALSVCAGTDCNSNGVDDFCDLLSGTSDDCNENGIPDDCEPGYGLDCNSNGITDFCDIYAGTSEDCNTNGIPDECDIASGTSPDCQGDGIPDECQLVGAKGRNQLCTTFAAGNGQEGNMFDLTAHSTLTIYQFEGNINMAGGPATIEVWYVTDHTTYVGKELNQSLWTLLAQVNLPSTNPAGTPTLVPVPDLTLQSGETCGIYFTTVGGSVDYTNGPLGAFDNGELRFEDRGLGGAYWPTSWFSPRVWNGCVDYDLGGGGGDCNTNGIPDECDVPPICDPATQTCSDDCNTNIIPDECEPDCNSNGIADECDIRDCPAGDPSCADCNTNEIPDSCDIADGTSNDINTNGVPDECEEDCNGNGIPDSWEILTGMGTDWDLNGVLDECDEDCNTNGVPDVCELPGGCAVGNCAAAPVACESGEDCQPDGILDECQLGGGAKPALNLLVSTRGLVNPGGHFVTIFDQTAAPLGQFDQVAGAQTSSWGYRDGCFDGTYVYFGWESGVAQMLPDGTSATQIISGSAPGGVATWRALAYDPTNLHGAPGLWVCSFSTALIKVDMTGALLASFPNTASWSLYGLAYNPSNGMLYGHHYGLGAEIWEIDPNTGTYTGNFIPSQFGTTASAQGGLDFAGDFFGVLQGTPDVMFQCDTAGVLTGSFSSNPFDLDAATGENGSLGIAAVGGAGGPGADCNTNGIPDECDVPPICDPATQTCSLDCNSNLIPDECEVAELDCNSNGIPDDCDIIYCDGSLWCRDCNNNGVPDGCDIADGTSPDCNTNGIPDECDIASGFSLDCNENGIPDECDIASGASADCQGDGIPDECQLYGKGGRYLYAWDDGTTENALGLTNGGEICWITHFTSIGPDSDCIESISTVYGSVGGSGAGVNPGDPVRVYVWGDPNGDGDPADAVFLHETVGAVDAGSIQTDVFQVIPLTSLVDISSYGSFFVGASVVHPAGNYPAPMDETASVNQAWLGYVVGGTYDPNTPGGQEPAPLNMTSIGYPCNWLLRAEGATCAAPANDCNTNGIPDECDIDVAFTIPGVCETYCVPAPDSVVCSTDYNHNCIPDECEICGDFDLDGDVDYADWWEFMQHYGYCELTGPWNPTNKYDILYDMDLDGCITLVDFQIWRMCYQMANGKAFVAPAGNMMQQGTPPTSGSGKPGLQ